MMTFGHLLRSADARLRLDLVRPAAVRLEGSVAPAARLAPALAAAAVANGVRMALARRHSGAAGPWLAERALPRLADLAPDAVPAAERALAFAKGDTGRMEAVTASLAAERALQLARLEAVVRSGYVDGRIGQEEHPEDVAEVAAMLARVPWDDLGGPAASEPLLPTLGAALPDAEPDLLVGGTLVTVSASRAPRVDEDDLRGLVARVVAARAERGPDEAAARVRQVGVLLARHGLLWRAPAAPLVAHEAFPAVEAWLAERLAPALRGPAPAGTREDAPSRAPLPKWVKKRFPPKAPGTHPQGKAERKKAPPAAKPPARPPPPPRAPPRAEMRGEPQDRREPEDGPAKPRGSRPDWRRGSAWRRDRGL